MGGVGSEIEGKEGEVRRTRGTGRARKPFSQRANQPHGGSREGSVCIGHASLLNGIMGHALLGAGVKKVCRSRLRGAAIFCFSCFGPRKSASCWAAASPRFHMFPCKTKGTHSRQPFSTIHPEKRSFTVACVSVLEFVHLSGPVATSHVTSSIPHHSAVV